MHCCSLEGNIPTKGEQHTCYMAEHLTIDLLYHYRMNNMYTCNIISHLKGDYLGSRLTVQCFKALFGMEFAVSTLKCGN